MNKTRQNKFGIRKKRLNGQLPLKDEKDLNDKGLKGR